MVAAVIFDLDGLLADTECLHCRAYQMALKEHGVQLEDHEYAEHWVRFGKGIADWMTIRGLALDPHALRLRKAKHYLDLLASSLRPMDGALDLLKFLSGRTKIALASSSYRDAIDGVLAGLGIAHFFEVIVSGLDVARGKTGAGHFSQGGGRSQCRALAMPSLGRRRERRHRGAPSGHALHRDSKRIHASSRFLEGDDDLFVSERDYP